jgi:hypothetical protein
MVVQTPQASDPWLLLKSDRGDVQVFAMCVTKGLARDLPSKGKSGFMESSALIDIIHRPQGALESPSSEWRAWIAWRGHARMVNLDVSRVCSGCGRLIEHVAVGPEGLIFVEH